MNYMPQVELLVRKIEDEEYQIKDFYGPVGLEYLPAWVLKMVNSLNRSRTSHILVGILLKVGFVSTFIRYKGE
jgi:hypothetical protein